MTAAFVARRMLLRSRAGTLVTVAAVAATVALQLFLFAVHEGVREGSTAYVRETSADIWVAQKNSDNILKSSSLLPASLSEDIARIPGVAAASPLLRVITKAEIRGRRSSTLFLLAFDPATRLGAPPRIVTGTSNIRDGELVLDRSFARKYALRAGDTLAIQGHRFRIAGLSDGTNALVSQFAFARFTDGESLLGIPGIASFILVRVSGDRAVVAQRIRDAHPDLAVYDARDFIQAHEDEMNSGVLPVFAAAAGFGAVVCVLLVALTLYNAVLAHREDYATLKAIGASSSFLLRVVLGQALLATAFGALAGGAIARGLAPLLLELVPALSLRFTPRLLFVFPACLVIGALAACAPVVLLRRIDPEEVFRA
ncbi:MAG TPA: FtsX-like permease family protein, partial [Thermoanaerobaculia bacterium]|nr:FtsX-like permease family protein [Thermoanaerobaculia bacterium]